VALSASQPAGSVSGTITDTSGRALPGATITLTSADRRVRTTVTDAAGRYGIGGLPSGRYRIEAQMDGFDRKVSGISIGSARAAAWGGALLTGPPFGEGSIEQKMARYTGVDAVDCGRHAATAAQAALEGSVDCAVKAVRAGQRFSVIVQSIQRGSHDGYGLFAGSDGVMQLFEYGRGGRLFRLQPCASPKVTASGSDQTPRFTCPVRRRQ
jgi:hypothetical protein